MINLFILLFFHHHRLMVNLSFHCSHSARTSSFFHMYNWCRARNRFSFYLFIYFLFRLKQIPFFLFFIEKSAWTWFVSFWKWIYTNFSYIWICTGLFHSLFWLCFLFFLYEILLLLFSFFFVSPMRFHLYVHVSFSYIQSIFKLDKWRTKKILTEKRKK